MRLFPLIILFVITAACAEDYLPFSPDRHGLGFENYRIDDTYTRFQLYDIYEKKRKGKDVDGDLNQVINSITMDMLGPCRTRWPLSRDRGYRDLLRCIDYSHSWSMSLLVKRLFENARRNSWRFIHERELLLKKLETTLNNEGITFSDAHLPYLSRHYEELIKLLLTKFQFKELSELNRFNHLYEGEPQDQFNMIKTSIKRKELAMVHLQTLEGWSHVMLCYQIIHHFSGNYEMLFYDPNQPGKNDCRIIFVPGMCIYLSGDYGTVTVNYLPD